MQSHEQDTIPKHVHDFYQQKISEAKKIPTPYMLGVSAFLTLFLVATHWMGGGIFGGVLAFAVVFGTMKVASFIDY